MSDSTSSLLVTDDEKSEIINALYERLFEKNRYVRETKALIESHEGHGDQCCFGPTRLEYQRESLAAFEQHRDLISDVLAKLEPEVERDDDSA